MSEPSSSTDPVEVSVATPTAATPTPAPAVPEPTTPTPPVAPPLPAEPTIAPPSATVQAFESGGGGVPPQFEAPQSKRSATSLIIVFGLLVAIAGIGFIGYTVYTGYIKPKTAAVITTPSPTTAPDDDTKSMQDLDSSIGRFDTNLSDADTTLDDKQGDLSE